MTNHGCLPFFWIMDKDFITSAKIVETFFDSAYNPRLPPAFTAAFDRKKLLAETVGESAELRQGFADLMRAKGRSDRDDVRDFAERLAAHLADYRDDQVAQFLAESLESLSDRAISDIQDELDADTWMRTTVGHSLPGLAQLLEGFMRKRPIELEIVHDNLVRYEAAFDQLRQMFRSSDGTDVTQIGGQTRFHSMPTVAGLRLADSESEPMIQQADLLCGFVRSAFTTIKDGHVLPRGVQQICLHLAMLQDELFTWDANMPRRMWQDFAQQTIGSAARGELDLSI